jgi:hypothetical protein
MQQFHQQPVGRSPSQRIFTASEVAEYEYCPLVWWYQQYEPLVESDNDELFASMVEMEQMYGPQATALPEYQVIEQLLVRRGAFTEGQEKQREHAQEVAKTTEIAEITGQADAEDEQTVTPGVVSDQTRRLMFRVMLALVVLALIMLVGAFFLTGH